MTRFQLVLLASALAMPTFAAAQTPQQEWEDFMKQPRPTDEQMEAAEVCKNTAPGFHPQFDAAGVYEWERRLILYSQKYQGITRGTKHYAIIKNEDGTFVECY